MSVVSEQARIHAVLDTAKVRKVTLSSTSGFHSLSTNKKIWNINSFSGITIL